MGAANSRPKAIENPLTDRPPSEIEASATVVYNDHLKDVVDKDVFLRGARLAQYPEDRVGVPGLTGAERLALDTEKTSNIFHQTNALRVTIMVTACAAITQGWQQSSINASSHRWQEEMRGDKSWRENQIQAGLIDAIPWLSASLLGTWLSDPLQEGKFGRRPALFVSGIFCTAFVLATARCNTFIELLVCRLLLGIGIGAKASVAPVFAAEAAADHLRGRLLMMWQLFDAFGIFAGFACVFIVDMDWRVILGTAAVPSIILLFVVFLCPESPRFSIRKRRYKEAFLSLRRLRGSDILACRDLYYIHIQLQHETKERMRIGGEDSSWLERYIYQDEELPRLNFFRRVWALWSFRRNRRACLAAFIVMASQQLCGVNVLAFYSSMVYRDASDDAENQTTQVAWLNFGFGLANFLFTIPAYWVIDGYYRKGRRLLLLVSLGGMFFTLVAISSFFLLPNDSDARLGLVSSFTIVIYLFFYGIGAGPVPFTFSAEVFPLAFREVGMSFSVMVNFLGLGLLVCFVPAITHAFERNGNAYLLYIFAGLDALAFVLVFLLVSSWLIP
ncbi:hypothetical protein BJX61DRAFT_530911 [Aspergillus egyptiacus]|nr:hypothetical protein BJX61DRAFT_530911 [Aspergillus egyptiacus]